MKRLVLAAFLALLATPGHAVARDKRDHRHMKAVEMAGVGMGAAVLLGAAGYLALRRSHAA